jgi:hypothetical protein
MEKLSMAKQKKFKKTISVWFARDADGPSVNFVDVYRREPDWDVWDQGWFGEELDALLSLCEEEVKRLWGKTLKPGHAVRVEVTITNDGRIGVPVKTVEEVEAEHEEEPREY